MMPPAAVAEHDPVVVDELGHVLVGRADQDPLDRRVGREPAGRGGDRVVGLELDHRPEHDARAPRSPASAIGNWASSSGGMPARRLVAREQVVAERLDDPVGRAADVGRALLAQQVEQLVAQPGDAGQDDAVAAEDRRPRRVVGPEQLVGRVDEVDLQDVRRLSHPGLPRDGQPASLHRVDRALAVAGRRGRPAAMASGRTDVAKPSRDASRAVALTQ